MGYGGQYLLIKDFRGNDSQNVPVITLSPIISTTGDEMNLSHAAYLEERANTTGEPKLFSESEVRRLVQAIYSEYAELPLGQHTTWNLRQVIQNEIENNFAYPIKIFKE